MWKFITPINIEQDLLYKPAERCRKLVESMVARNQGDPSNLLFTEEPAIEEEVKLFAVKSGRMIYTSLKNGISTQLQKIQ